MARLIRRRGFMLALAAAPFFIGRAPLQAESLMKPIKGQRWSCTNQDCEPYIYDPRLGAENLKDPDNPIPPGVAFEDLPDTWLCPICGDPKSSFLRLSH